MKEGNNSSAGGWIAVVAGAIALYILSIGPVVLYYDSTYKTPPKWIETVYLPIGKLVEHSKTAERLLITYLDFIGVVGVRVR